MPPAGLPLRVRSRADAAYVRESSPTLELISCSARRWASRIGSLTISCLVVSLTGGLETRPHLIPCARGDWKRRSQCILVASQIRQVRAIRPVESTIARWPAAIHFALDDRNRALSQTGRQCIAEQRKRSERNGTRQQPDCRCQLSPVDRSGTSLRLRLACRPRRTMHWRNSPRPIFGKLNLRQTDSIHRQ
jgi:hypothetical protein